MCTEKFREPGDVAIHVHWLPFEWLYTVILLFHAYRTIRSLSQMIDTWQHHCSQLKHVHAHACMGLPRHLTPNKAVLEGHPHVCKQSGEYCLRGKPGMGIHTHINSSHTIHCPGLVNPLPRSTCSPYHSHNPMPHAHMHMHMYAVHTLCRYHTDSELHVCSQLLSLTYMQLRLPARTCITTEIHFAVNWNNMTATCTVLTRLNGLAS